MKAVWEDVLKEAQRLVQPHFRIEVVSVEMDKIHLYLAPQTKASVCPYDVYYLRLALQHYLERRLSKKVELLAAPL